MSSSGSVRLRYEKCLQVWGNARSTLLGETVLAGEDPDDLVITNGGAAATAYARLQFEELEAEPRQKICEALLRYCELDTLAMVMIVEAWKELVVPAKPLKPA